MTPDIRSPVDEHGRPIDPWQFFEGRRLEPRGAIRFPVKPAGQELDFSWAAFSIPVVHYRFVQIFQGLHVPDVQFLPVEVEAHPGPYFIRFVAGMRIDPSKMGDARIFRTWGWDIALIVSEDIKQAIESEGLSGARFVEV